MAARGIPIRRNLMGADVNCGRAGQTVISLPEPTKVGLATL
jgi:hypothetical protein